MVGAGPTGLPPLLCRGRRQDRVVKRNPTVRLDEATIDKARVLAARRGTSISKLVAEEISRLVAEDDRYQHARDCAVQQLEAGFHMAGGQLPDRQSTHER